ncbi:hypothetical protein MTR_8g466990 [Medicago truncatula]|uniref:Uncharacterized protein n=1 Tax=Medicago truncatula TaxID=3880 RepID=A0A072TS62_MEDTR|nr:hypothetical protein MTR_8g466990 [Medicago truncatula]
MSHRVYNCGKMHSIKSWQNYVVQTTQKRETRIFEGQNCVRLRLDKAAKSTYKSHSVCDKRDKFYYPGPSVLSSNPQQTLTNASLVALRQQMEDCNHEMVNMLTQEIGTMFNPLIRDTHNNYLALPDQIGRIADFSGSHPRRNVQIPQVQNPRSVEEPINRPNDRNLVIPVPQPVVERPVPGVQGRVPILVQRNQDPDQIVRQAQQVNLEGQNNIANVVENLLTQNGLNLGLHRPNFVSPLSEYVAMEELSKGWKIPKFGGETNESIVEHIAHYLT